MDRIGATLHRTTAQPLVTPRAVPGLVTKRVLAMDYLAGVPLSRSLQLMQVRACGEGGISVCESVVRQLDCLAGCLLGEGGGENEVWVIEEG